MPESSADRNLLFGVLALQLDFIHPDALITAMNSWALNKSTPLGDILCEQGALSKQRRDLLEALVQDHLTEHGDARSSLESMSMPIALRDGLGAHGIADKDLLTSLETLSTRTLPSRGDTTASLPAAPSTRYRRMRLHARGGLGEVFLAEDSELHREVALKEIKDEWADDAFSRNRFILEAEITGGLEHPGIVPVYGMGAYPDGRPFYAMRFIRGESLRQAIDRFHAADKPGRDAGERNLAFRQLLGRLVSACQAVAYAHSRGVLHRDLKPANIMLGPFGETLVVDWGLAKAGVSVDGIAVAADDKTTDPVLRPSLGSDALATAAGTAVGTPAFMSPEQAAGKLAELCPASDVYSLGCTLYGLLTGKRAFAAMDDEELMRQVRAGQFAPPRQMKPGTPPALDAICRKAMAARAADRYPTALALAADLEHWLADEPVEAYPEPLPARLRRWSRRHRAALTAAMVVVVLAVVGLSGSTALLYQEQKKTAAAQDKAEKNFESAVVAQQKAEKNFEMALGQAYASLEMIIQSDIEFASDPAKHTARLEILKSATKAFRQYLEQDPKDQDLRHKAAIAFRYGALAHRVAYDTQPAHALYTDAIALEQKLAEQNPSDPSYRNQQAEILRDFAAFLVLVGKLREAAATSDAALAAAESLLAADPKNTALRRGVQVVVLDRASIDYARGKLAESKRAVDRAVAGLRELTALEAPQRHPYDPLLLAAALTRQAVLERDAGNLDGARAIHGEAMKILIPMNTKVPEKVVPADVYHHLALSQLELCRTQLLDPKRRAVAQGNLAKAAEQWGTLAKAFPKVPQYAEMQAIALVERGRSLTHDNKLEESSTDLELARTILEKLTKQHPDLPGLHGDLGRDYIGLGQLAKVKGDDPAAAAWWAKATASLETAVSGAPDDLRDRRSLEECRTLQKQ
jgi:eukaryotic-like serine/threonine-protein kinase